MQSHQYQIFVPGGNKTALVLGLEGFDAEAALRKAVQDKILANHEHDTDGEVEQVGFISLDKSSPELIMTGGEFCGNATRSAAAYYLLDARSGEIEIKVSGTNKPVKAGLSSKGKQLEAWAEMPLIEDLSKAVIPLEGALYWVSIEGISHLIVPQDKSIPFLQRILSCESKDAQISIAIELLKKTIAENSLSMGKACGVIFLECVSQGSGFLESLGGILKMHPFVHVAAAGTTYYETACGSGTMCVGLLDYFLRRKNVNMRLLQPSGKIITAEVECSDTGALKKGRISGEIQIGEILEV